MSRKKPENQDDECCRDPESCGPWNGRCILRSAWLETLSPERLLEEQARIRFIYNQESREKKEIRSMENEEQREASNENKRPVRYRRRKRTRNKDRGYER